MKEKTLLKIAFVLTIIAIILYVICVITFADNGLSTTYSHYKPEELNHIKYVLPNSSVIIRLPSENWEQSWPQIYVYYCADDRGNIQKCIYRYHRYKIASGSLVDPYIETSYVDLKDKTSKGTLQTSYRKFWGTSNKFYTYKIEVINESDMIAAVFFDNDFYDKHPDASIEGGYSTYTKASTALGLLPQISGSFLETNTYLPHSANAANFEVIGYNLPEGNLNISLHKIVDGNKTRVKTITSTTNDISEINERYECGQLELGEYEIEIMYTYPDVETGLNKVAFDTLNFTISNSSSQDGTYEVSLGDSIHTVDNYFNRIWIIENPIKNLTYNSVPSVRIKGNLEFLEKQGILQKWGYKNVDNIDEIDVSLPYGLGKLNSVWLNDYYLGEFNFENVESLNFNFNIPESKLNRGLNTIYITSYTGSDVSRTYANFERNGSYHHLFSGIDFYYKTSDQPGPGGGGVGGDDPYNDGIDIGSPPNRANYQSGLYGDIQFALDYIVYLIKIPFKVIFGGLGWLVENFTNMFSWVGELTSMIGTWFGFLPSEIRLLILGVIVCTFVGFAISIFKK